MKKDKFVEDVVGMIGSDAQKIRKLLRIHPRRDIPAKIVKKYSTMSHMLSHLTNGSLSRDTLSVLCAMVCTVTRGRLNGQIVMLVDGQDLSEDPKVVEKREAAIVEKKASAEAKRQATLAKIKAEKAKAEA